jgi:signal transduction histidine kinase/CheY-like chemotaxis protein
MRTRDAEREELHPPEAPGSGLRRTSALLVGLGLAVVAMLIAVERIAERHVVDYAPALTAASRLRVEVATSHLWLEEHLTGDAQVDVAADVLAPMRHAEELIAALLDGREAGGGAAIEALSEASLRRRVEGIDLLLDRFRALAVTRVRHSASSGVGSPLDQRYDAVFRSLLAEVAELESAIGERLVAGRRRSRWLFGAILAAWTALVGGALAALVHRDRRRRRTEAVLAEREEQLAQAQKLEAVGRLAGGLAHDVNNYLAAINAQCGLIRLKRPGDGELAGMLDEIGDTVGRVAALLGRLLAFSRSRPLAPQVIDLNERAREMGGMMRRLLGDDVTLELHLEDELWTTEVDPVEVEQVLVNLLVNAREAMPGGGRVTLTTANRRLVPRAREGEAAQATAGDWVVLSVSDSGAGIPDDVRERIFEPFFSTKGRSGHSGLGLATVYGVARRAGGFVRVESTPGAGARFDVHLPRSRRPADAAAPARRAAPAAAGPPARLLLVEDNAALAVATAAFLAEAGHRVTRVGDGRRALARLEDGQAFDAVVSDLVLPSLSGREVCERARRVGLPVVLLSAFPDRVEIDDLLADPCVRFLSKPFAPEALLAALGEVFEAPRRAARRTPAAAL